MAQFLHDACVARPVSKKEIASTPECQIAQHKEWTRLKQKGVFDLSSVRNWKDVAREANAAGRIIHMGRVFGIMVEKNYESVDHRKYKYRVVFQGNNVVTQNYDVALFQDMGSQPASMEAGKAADCYGLFENHDVEQADAEQAYIQADLTGTETWVALPRDAWPDEWFDKPAGASTGDRKSVV